MMSELETPREEQFPLVMKTTGNLVEDREEEASASDTASAAGQNSHGV